MVDFLRVLSRDLRSGSLSRAKSSKVSASTSSVGELPTASEEGVESGLEVTNVWLGCPSELVSEEPSNSVSRATPKATAPATKDHAFRLNPRGSLGSERTVGSGVPPTIVGAGALVCPSTVLTTEGVAPETESRRLMGG